ncbi:sigma factor-like helix-turn-helix DNA-binding protein [Pseudomonas sp. M47T1]|uniref:sigma factor-like helix-turn-helix DNA-binding protein n=1 Tax=Pseudomonas sp. M47T1 TaxID=1179778 RepID=UPI0002F32F5F|nr:sigma factor-like helix-turn-helix DNA-binding protein [Pseudomonas sp. M47T1]
MTHLLTPLHNLFQPQPVDQGQDALYLRLKKLPRRVVQVFLLSRLDNLPYPAIAQRLDISVAQVEKEMLQALEQCRSQSGSQAASAWYVKLQNPQTTASERIDFRRWLDANTAHLQAFHGTELRWRQLLAAARHLGRGGWYQHRRRHGGLLGWVMAVVGALLVGGLAGWI